MKRFLSVLFLFALMLSITVFAYNAAETVYVTNTGTKYHAAGCSYLQSSNALTLQQAVESGYTPCSRCHPPIPDFEYTVQQQLPERASSSSSSGGVTRSSSSTHYESDVVVPTSSPKPTKEAFSEKWYFELVLYATVFVCIFILCLICLAADRALKRYKRM